MFIKKKEFDEVTSVNKIVKMLDTKSTGGMVGLQKVNVQNVAELCLGAVVARYGVGLVALIGELVNVREILGISSVVERLVGSSILSFPTNYLNL